MERTFSDYFNTPDAKLAQKALDYLDGKQIEHVISLLDDPSSGRREWRERGMRPNYRNIVGMIVEKSGMLFQNQPPQLELYPIDSEESDDPQTQELTDILDDADWVEFFINVDQVVRLLKTAIVLVQFDDQNAKIILDCLHRGNAYVRRNPITREVVELIYRVDLDTEEKKALYRVYTNELIEDWVEELGPHRAKATLVQSQVNPYGMIPAATFYDTKVPRVGYWNTIPSDLIHLNEAYNLYLVDLEFGSSWSIHKTLFTNARIEGQVSSSTNIEQVHNSPLPRMTNSSPGVVGGLSKVVQLDTAGVENPFVEFKGPEVDLEAPTKVMSNWVRDYAGDWGVRVKVAGEGTANSGFQLIVEEFDNIELKKTRAKMFSTGLQRVFDAIKGIWNYHFPGTFSDNVVCYAEFSEPSLPTDKKQDEEIWSLRLNEKRATPIDYYMEAWGLTKEEAEEKWMEVRSFWMTNGAVDPTEIEGLWSQRIYEGRATREDYFRSLGLSEDEIASRMEKINSSAPPREPPTQKFEVSV